MAYVVTMGFVVPDQMTLGNCVMHCIRNQRSWLYILMCTEYKDKEIFYFVFLLGGVSISK